MYDFIHCEGTRGSSASPPPLLACAVQVLILSRGFARNCSPLLPAACAVHSGAHVLILSRGCGGALALLAAGAGAGAVTCVENGPLAFRMSTQLLAGNKHLKGHSVIRVSRGDAGERASGMGQIVLQP